MPILVYWTVKSIYCVLREFLVSVHEKWWALLYYLFHCCFMPYSWIWNIDMMAASILVQGKLSRAREIYLVFSPLPSCSWFLPVQRCACKFYLEIYAENGIAKGLFMNLVVVCDQMAKMLVFHSQHYMRWVRMPQVPVGITIYQFLASLSK